jgi:hypothetical protein
MQEAPGGPEGNTRGSERAVKAIRTQQFTNHMELFWYPVNIYSRIFTANARDARAVVHVYLLYTHRCTAQARGSTSDELEATMPPIAPIL